MDVILLRDVDKLGLKGELVAVAPGYHRNFLAPRKLAQTATPALVAEIRKRDEARARHEARTLDQARAIAETLTKTILRFDVKSGSQGVLFGSITASDIADELWRTRRIRVDRRKIALVEPIKRVGTYEVTVEVFPEVTVDIKTIVAGEGEAVEEAAPPAAPPQPAADDVFEEPDWGELG